jgi:hypothetical protein
MLREIRATRKEVCTGARISPEKRRLRKRLARTFANVVQHCRRAFRAFLSRRAPSAYSLRSTSVMFNRAMGRLAIHTAIAPIAATRTAHPAYLAVLNDFAPLRKFSSKRSLRIAPATPGVAPTIIVISPWLIRPARSREGVVPSAIRTPSSRVLRATAAKRFRKFRSR